ncbi:MAG: hypothetical protein R2942_13230 [Ignavibacteria bacterium]
MEIIPENFQENYKVVGIVKPFESAKVSSEEGGLITYQPFDKGSRVSKGQVVVRLRKDQMLQLMNRLLLNLNLLRVIFKEWKNYIMNR